MHRNIEHSAFVRRSFADICHILERDADTMLETATAATSDRTAELVSAAGETLPHFDPTEQLAVIVDEADHSGEHRAWIDFTWHADRRKRLLANVDAHLDIRPLVRARPPTTELTLQAHYDPAPGARHSPETVLFGRRIVNAALHRLLTEIVTYLETYEETVAGLSRIPKSRTHRRANNRADHASIERPTAPTSTLDLSPTALPATRGASIATTRASTRPPTAHPFHKILFAPLHTNARRSIGLEEAMALAATNGASITVFDVVAPPPDRQRAIRLSSGGDTVNQVLVAEAEARLRSLAQPRGADPDIDITITTGDRAVEIVRHAISGDFDLVVVDTGTTTQNPTALRRILRLCPCPVWIPRPHHGTAVLAAIDPDDDNDLTQQILAVAHHIAQHYDEDLHVLHTWQTHGLATLTTSEFSPVPSSLLTSLYDDVETRHRQALDTAVSAADLPATTTTHLIDAPPADGITRFVIQRHIDTLVIGSVGRTGLDGVLTGNTAEHLIDHIDCSLLVIKPPGFTSPVKPYV